MKLRAVALACLMAACGGARGPLRAYFTAVQAGHPSYPDARFITGQTVHVNGGSYMP